MSAVLLLTAALAGLQTTPPARGADDGAKTEARPEIPPPPPRRPIAGLEGFECVSSVVFPSAADRPHRLRSTFVFPDRARWQLTVADEKHGDRDVRYRYGEHFYLLRAGSRRSEECAGEERDEMLLALELRRALLLYPDGFEWKDAGPERRADVGGLGALVARPTSAVDAKPAEMRAVTRTGKLVEAYQAIVWREKNGRSWPSALELWHENELVWRETIESIDIEGKVIDAFFLPADRRPATGSPMPIDAAREQLLPPYCGLRVEIPKGSTWTEAAEGYVRLREEWNGRLRDRGLAVDRHATVEVGANGEPLVWIVRLDRIPDEVPSGFTTVPPRRGVVCAVRDPSSITAERIRNLAGDLPKGSKAGSAYARFESKAADGPIVLVLPYAPERGG